MMVFGAEMGLGCTDVGVNGHGERDPNFQSASGIRSRLCRCNLAALIFIGDHDGGDPLFKDVACGGIVPFDDLLSRAADWEHTKLWTYLTFYGLGPHLFRLGNRGKREWWIMANTPQEAIDLSVTAGMARSPHAVRVVSIATNHYLQQPDGERLRRLRDRRVVGLVVYDQPGGSGWILTRDLSSLVHHGDAQGSA